jgi:hypothetical protein
VKAIRVSVALATVASAFVFGPAAAYACIGDPSVAALDQYCDAMPTADGGPPTGSGRDARPLALVLPASEVVRLRAAGPAGRALLLMPVVAPASARDAARRHAKRKHNGARNIALTSGTTASKVIESAVRATDGLGPLRWVLLASTLTFAGFAWLRFKRASF